MKKKNSRRMRRLLVESNLVLFLRRQNVIELNKKTVKNISRVVYFGRSGTLAFFGPAFRVGGMSPDNRFNLGPDFPGDDKIIVGSIKGAEAIVSILSKITGKKFFSTPIGTDTKTFYREDFSNPICLGKKGAGTTIKAE
jgi:hypothetical protein